jgi:hypothetical protein
MDEVDVRQIFSRLFEHKIVRETRYYADPFEAPEWRAQLVETMEEA